MWLGLTDVCRMTYNWDMTRMQVYFEDDHKEALEQLALRKGVKYSQMVRRALGVGIEKLLEEEKTYKFNRAAWMKFVGAGGVAHDKDIARNIDKILYIDPYK